MVKPVLDVGAEIVRLEQLTLENFREEWRRTHQVPPPRRLSRDMLLRGIIYKIQEDAFGGLSKAARRSLLTLNPNSASPTAGPHVRPSFKPGTRLVREWHGITHTVIVLQNGFEWRGKRYRSLSVVAREITGAHWSGPRFFGVTTEPSDG